jgi:ABC-type sulfate/molybdate transport systems ATPase subunit
MNALDALAAALSEFKGAVAVVSHNRSFLTACCTELWVVDKGTVRIDRPPAGDESAEAFAQLFAEYASRVLGHGTGGAGAINAVASKASRAASALDSASSKAAKRGGNLKSAGAASNRAGFI